jgi:cation transport regulator ChaB
MPYQTNDELPAAVKKLPVDQQAAWRGAFNAAWETYKDQASQEALANATAWATVRKQKAAAEPLPLEEWAKDYELHTGSRRLMLFPRGEFTHPEYGRMVFDDAFFGEIRANFEGAVLGQTKPFIDVDHNHQAAAGWIEGLTIEPDGLYAAVDWTQFGEEKINSGEYRFFSPWWGSYQDPATGRMYDRVLRGGALTNIPFLKVLPPVQLFEPSMSADQRTSAWKSGRTFMLSEIRRAGGDTHDLGSTLAAIVREARVARVRQLVAALTGG